tara:strand:- start:251 stop:1102 length:852 start_codon:yes stop_codon:yes gene_type:complete
MHINGKDAIEARLNGQVVWSDQSLSDLDKLIQQLYGTGLKGAVYIPRPVVNSSQVLWQDADMTVPVAADGDPVRVMQDLSGAGRDAIAPTSAARAIYKTDGVSHKLLFDGIDDHYVISKTMAQSVEGLWVSAAINFLSFANTTEFAVAWFSKGDSSSATRFRLNAINSSTLQCAGRRLDSDGFDSGAFTSDIIVRGEPAVLTGSAEYINQLSLVRKNGVEVNRKTPFSTQGISDAAASQEAFLGRIANNYSNMEFYGAVFQGATGESIGDAEQYLADISGVVL